MMLLILKLGGYSYNMKIILLILISTFCFGCHSSNNDFVIIDKSLEIEFFSCAEALEPIYSDADYEIFLPCIKSKYIVVKMSDGTEINIIDALKDKIVEVEDLDKFNIKYYKRNING